MGVERRASAQVTNRLLHRRRLMRSRSLVLPSRRAREGSSGSAPSHSSPCRSSFHRGELGVIQPPLHNPNLRPDTAHQPIWSAAQLPGYGASDPPLD